MPVRAENEIEREREQAGDQDFVDQGRARGNRRRSPPAPRARTRSPASASARGAADARRGASGSSERVGALIARRPGEQALRAQDQRDDHHHVDDEGADRGDVIFAGDVEHAEQQRAEQRAQNAVRAADRDDDQERDHEFEREGRIDAADDIGGERAAEPGEAAADREGDREQQVDVDRRADGDARIVDRGAQPRAEARPDQKDLQRRGDRRRRRR